MHLLKATAKFTGAALLIGGLTLLLLEAMVAVFLPQQEHMEWMMPSDRYGHVGKPHFQQRYRYAGTDFVMDVQTNSLGFRDEEPAPATEDTTTILLLGDSFVFGYGVNVEDRFDTHLRTRLDGGDGSLRIINLGMGGWGTLQETRHARDHFDLFQPDIVVLTFCGNDPLDDKHFHEGVFLLGEPGRVHFPGKKWVWRNSHLYRFAALQYYHYRHRAYLREQLAGEDADLGEMPATSEAGAEMEGGGLDLQTGVLLREEDLRGTQALLREFHADLLAFNPEAKLFLQLSAPDDAFQAGFLRELDDGMSLFFVDFADAVAGIPEEERWALPMDRHWSPRMHEISGEHLAAAIAPHL